METTSTAVLGMTFCPPELELTDLYLSHEITGDPIPFAAGFFHHADIYSAEPEELVEGLQHAPGTDKGDKPQPVWYFLSPVRCVGRGQNSSSSGKKMQRAVIDGKTWHMESQKPVMDSAVGGHVKTFSYVTSGPGRGRQRLGWIMKEYSIATENGGADLVLCKIYRSNYGKKSSSAAAVSNSGESSTNKKRKAAASCEHPEALPSARPKQTHDQENYSAAAGLYLYGPTDQLPPCSAQDGFLQSSSELYQTSWITEELLPPFSTQDGFLPSSSELYETTSAYMPAGGELDLGLPSLTQEQLEPPLPEGFQAFDDEMQQMMFELIRNDGTTTTDTPGAAEPELTLTAEEQLELSAWTQELMEAPLDIQFMG